MTIGLTPANENRRTAARRAGFGSGGGADAARIPRRSPWGGHRHRGRDGGGDGFEVRRSGAERVGPAPRPCGGAILAQGMYVHKDRVWVPRPLQWRSVRRFRGGIVELARRALR